MNRIIYQVEGQPLSVLIPAQDTGMSLLQIGEKDVPRGCPFWIVDLSVIPEDRSMRLAWELDMDIAGKPSGYGK